MAMLRVEGGKLVFGGGTVYREQPRPCSCWTRTGEALGTPTVIVLTQCSPRQSQESVFGGGTVYREQPRA